MEQTTFTESLMEFGLTRQEASIYQCLLTEGKVKKHCKISKIQRKVLYLREFFADIDAANCT